MKNFLLSLIIVLISSSPAHALLAGGCGTACHANGGYKTSGGHEVLFQWMPWLWCQLIFIAAFYVTGYVMGLLVQRKTISPSVSRKIVCVFTFAVSYINSSWSAHGYAPYLSFMLITASCAVILLLLASLTSPMRNRVPALRTVFLSINRPEDEPYTLAWLATEAIATGLIIMIFSFLMETYLDSGDINDLFYLLILIPIFASGIGDALAEIVGKRWGRHCYQTKSIWGKRVYTRSLEGSAMVFLTTLVVGLIIAISFRFQLPIFVWKALILLPITLTLAEAKAPHTWDNPFLYLTGYLTIIFCLWS